jgi:hypothetical protein
MASWLSVAVATVSVSTFLISFGLMARLPSNGLNLTDESFYLLAVDPDHRGDAFNGLWGYYVRLLWQVAGWNLGVVRLLGLAILVLTAAALGDRLAPAISFSRITTIAVCASGAVGFYSVGLRTPSYNWLAVEGAALAATALLPNGCLAGKRDAGLAALGIFLAGTGKPTTGVICLFLVAVLSLWPGGTSRRLPVATAFSSTMLGLLVLHFAFMLSPPETFSVLHDSAATMRSIDPEHYSFGGSITFMATTVGDLLTTQTVVGGALFGVLPILAFLSRARRKEWFTVLAVTAVLAATTYSIGNGSWGGGGPGWGGNTGGLALLTTTTVLVIICAAALRIADRSGFARPVGQSVRLGVVFGAATLATAWGSNTGLGFVLNFAALLVIAFTLVLSNYFEPPTAAAVKQALSVAGCGAVMVMSVQGVLHPFGMETWQRSTHPFTFGRVDVQLGPDYAGKLDRLTLQARTAGWTDGTRLIDTTFTPGIGLALNSTVPRSLLPAVPGYRLSSICTTITPRSHWHDAWIMIRKDLSLQDREFVAAVLGRSYPDGYARVGRWDVTGREAELWKPVGAALRSPAAVCADAGSR